MASCSGGDGGNYKKENRTFNVGGVEFAMGFYRAEISAVIMQIERNKQVAEKFI